MKICMITPGWLPAHTGSGAGGIEVHVQYLLASLVEGGHDVTIITTKHPKGIKKEKTENLSIHYAGDSPLRCNKSFYQESFELFRTLNGKEKFDIVHTQDYAGYGIFKKSKLSVPSVVTAHGTPLNMLKGIIKAKSVKSMPQIPKWITYHFAVAPTLFHKADKVIAVSNELREDIISQYSVNQKKVVTIPNGIDVQKFKPLELPWLRRKFSIDENKKVLLFVGGISKNKGVHILIRAFNFLSKYRDDVILLIVGTGSYIVNMKTLTANLGLKDKVAFLDGVPSNDIPYYYNLADIVVVPSVWVEAFGIVVIEAMASGKPVVASNIGGIPTAVEHLKTGILVKPGDYTELSKWIVKLLEDKAFANTLGANARKRAVTEFSLDSMVENTIKVYESFIQLP